MRGLALGLVAAALFPAAASAQSLSLLAPDPDCTVVAPARMLDGGALRVCQSEWNFTSAYFSGYLAMPLAAASAGMHVALPDEGTVLELGESELVPLASPLEGVTRTAGYRGDTPVVQITETARVAPGAHGYTLTYALTNTSGAPLKLLPRVDLSGYDEHAPALTTTGGPRALTIASPVSGGFVRLREVTPAAAGYTGGAAEALDYDALDDTLHPADNGFAARVALGWFPVTLNPGATATYTVAIDAGQPRELLLTLPEGQSPLDPTVRLDARVTDERVTAGSVVRFAIGGASGSAALAADGTGRVTVPVALGRSALLAWFDADNDGTLDVGEPNSQADFDVPFRPLPPPVINPPPPPAWNPLPPTAPPNAAITLPFKATYKIKRCAGKRVQLRLKDGSLILARKTVKLDKRCRIKTSFRITMSQYRGTQRLRVELHYRGGVRRYKL